MTKTYYYFFIFAFLLQMTFIAAEKRPNIVILLADDLAWADLTINNPKAYTETPNLEKLASQGAIFSDGYSSAPMCSPSRSGMMTGRVPLRVGVHDWIKERFKKPVSDVHLRQSETTIAELLKKVGYQTGAFGKWHMNNEFRTGNNSDPDHHGFDHWYCAPVHAEPSHKNPNNFYLNGKAVGQENGFAANLCVDRAIEWLDKRDREKPFFVYLPFAEAHVVCAAPDKTIDKYMNKIAKKEIPLKKGSGKKGLGQAEYYGCIDNMDKAIGDFLTYLERIGEANNTLIIFSADNGPDSNRKYKGRLQSVGENLPLTGRKRWLNEGGIRVPTIVRYPKVLKAGQTIKAPISNVDYLPTICEIAGVSIPQDRIIDGTSFLPLLKGKKLTRKTALHWHFYAPYKGPNSVLRRRDWVLTAEWTGPNKIRGRFNPAKNNSEIKQASLTNFSLYNIRKDIGQKTDIKNSHPEIFLRLKRELIKLHKSARNEAPIWNSGLPKY